MNQPTPNSHPLRLRSVSNWPVIVSYSVALVIFAALAYLSFQSVRTIRTHEEAIGQTLSVMRLIEASMATITDAETGQRGYLLTGDRDYLEPYYAARAKHAEQLRALRAATASIPVQQQRLDELDELVAVRFSKLAEVLRKFDLEGRNTAIESVGEDRGQQLMVQIRKLHNRMLADEQQRLELRRISSEREYRRSIATGFGGGILGLLVVVLSFVLVDRELAARRLAEAELRDRTSQLHLLSDVVARVSAARDVKSVTGIALKEVRQLVGAREALVDLSPGRDYAGPIERAYASTEPQVVAPQTLQQRMQVGDKLAGDNEFFFSDAEHLALETLTPEERAIAAHFGGLLRVPLVGARRNTIGVLQLSGKLDGEFEQRDLLIASQLAHTTGVAIENARLTRALQQADRRKDEFLAMLGHELRNPLAGILTGIEAIGTDDPNPEIAMLKQMIDRQSRYMTRIVDDLLDVSRIARGKIRLMLTELDLIEVTRNAVIDYCRSQSSDRVRFVNETSASSMPMRGDRTRIAQCIGNLIHNACKFSEEEVVVCIAADSKRDKHFGVISVTDRGVGMQPHELDAIFDTFHQNSATIDRSQGGLGLGLTLVRGLVAMHGGTVAAASAGLNQGTEFTIRLPLDESALRGTWQQDDSIRTDEQPQVEPQRILIIDDRRDAILPLRVLLSRAGHTVLEASDGQEGLDTAEREKPDIILCDIGLPGSLNGYDVARQLRKLPGFADRYLVAISGYSQQSDRDAAAEVGFDYHVAKPVSKMVLDQLVRKRPSFNDTVPNGVV